MFTTQPQSQTRYVGGSVTFTSVAGGLSAPTYQWRLDDRNIDGATSANYSIASVQTGHAGKYTVVARNSFDSVTSAVAVLTVLTSPAPLVVTNTTDAGAGSLRQAIFNAESVTNPVVTFASDVTGTITLTSGEIAITKNLTINGPGANILSVSGNFTSRIFEVLSGTVLISGLTIRDGREIEGIGFPEENGAKARGGGIMNQATLTLTGCIIRNNAVVPGRGGDSLENGTVSFAGGGGNGSGGGICNIETLTMNDCSLIDNSATGGEGGNDSGGNNGMGGQGYGGGLYTLGTATLTRCSMSGNHATAGIGAGGVGGGSGGGIYNDLSLSLLNCTVASNSADGSPFDFGGGICDNGTVLTIRNSTVFGNQADFGGGLSIGGANVGNTILAGNSVSASGSGSGPDCTGSMTSSDYNLIQNINGFSIAGTTTHNIVGQAPLLGPLQDNGGPTATMALLSNSPAINGGDDALAPKLDQRGYLRFGVSDIGAFEFGGTPLRITSFTLLANGHAVLQGIGVPNSAHTIHASADLSSNSFAPLTQTATADGTGALQYDDAGAAGLRRRFYRLSFP